jgi:hypothetical protein
MFGIDGDDTVAPLGLWIVDRCATRGLRPWLLTVAPLELKSGERCYASGKALAIPVSESCKLSSGDSSG